MPTLRTLAEGLTRTLRRQRRKSRILAIGIVVYVAIIAITAWFQQNLDVQTLTTVEAEVEFENIRKRFAGRGPLLVDVPTRAQRHGLRIGLSISKTLVR